MLSTILRLTTDNKCGGGVWGDKAMSFAEAGERLYGPDICIKHNRTRNKMHN